MMSVMASRAAFIIAELTVVGSVLLLLCGVGYDSCSFGSIEFDADVRRKWEIRTLIH